MPIADEHAIPDMLITTYLRMTDRSQFMPSLQTHQIMTITHMVRPDGAFYRFLYQSVGEKWHWRDRLVMPVDELEQILKREGVDVFVLYQGGVPGGYIELDKQGEHTEIAYFGLREPFMGRGLGKYLLSWGVKRAWDEGASRVWVHTCNLDGPHALRNYRARGFEVYNITEEPMPERYL